MSFPECRDFFKENLAVRDFSGHHFVYQNSLVIVIDVFLRGEDWTGSYSLKSLDLWFEENCLNRSLTLR